MSLDRSRKISKQCVMIRNTTAGTDVSPTASNPEGIFITFDTEDVSDTDFYTTDLGAGTITILKDGTYRCSYQINVQTGATNGSNECKMRGSIYRGANQIDRSQSFSLYTESTNESIANNFIVDASAGDVLSLAVARTAGTTRTQLFNMCYLYIEKIF